MNSFKKIWKIIYWKILEDWIISDNKRYLSWDQDCVLSISAHITICNVWGIYLFALRKWILFLLLRTTHDSRRIP